MGDPASAEEYAKLFHENQKIFGYGLEVSTSMPCPFCAAPDWITYRIIDTDSAVRNETTCGSCGRSGKFVFHVDKPGQKSFEFIQTGGTEPPEWLLPKLRRL